MQKRRSICRFVLGMRTRHPFAVEVVTMIDNAGTNGVALKQALADPYVNATYDPEHIGIVRVSDGGPHLRKDLDGFCRKMGLTDEMERAIFIQQFAQSISAKLDQIEEQRNNSRTGIPITKSRWGRAKK